MKLIADGNAIRNEKGECLAICYGDDRHALAPRIARAVNCHDALVTACEAALEMNLQGSPAIEGLRAALAFITRKES